MHFIELPKFKLGDIKRLRKSEKWIVLFSNKCTDEELEEIAMSEPAIKKALEYQAYFMHDAKLRHKYELQEKAIRDYNSSMLAAREEAKEEGRQEGRQEGFEEGKKEEKIQTAINFLKLGAEPSFVARGTGLTLDKVLEIQRNLLK